jgi:hypothetical protein
MKFHVSHKYIKVEKANDEIAVKGDLLDAHPYAKCANHALANVKVVQNA